MSWFLSRTALLALAGLLLLPPGATATVEVSGLTHRDGTTVEAHEVSGNSLFVVFSTWSPKCRDIIERVNEMHGEWGGRARIFLVNFQESAAAVDKFLSASPPPVEVLLDPDASFSKNHKITYLPSLLAVKDGSVAFRGKLPSDTDSVLRSIYE